MALLLKGGKVFINNEFHDLDILIEGNKIIKIGKNLKSWKKLNVKNKIIFPGLINLHTHVAMSLFRGISDDADLHTWLNRDIWPREAKLNYKDVYWGSMLGILEMLYSGTTAFLDMYFYEESVVNAAFDLGIRAFLSYGIIDLNDQERAKEELRKTNELKEYIEALNSDLINFVYGPHAPYTVSQETLEKIARFNGLKTIHVSETRKEVEDIKKLKNKRPIEYLDSLNFLNDQVIIAHAVHLSDKEFEILRKRKTTIAHCPTSNLKLASGVFNLKKAFEFGINVGLGTDGAASNNMLNMMHEMRIAALIHKLNNNAVFPTIYDIFSMATKNGAMALKIKAGEIKEGYLADLFIVDKKDINLIPGYNPLSSLVFSPPQIDSVIVNGKVIIKGKELLTYNKDRIIDKAIELKDKFIEV